ncbi:MAG: class I SAM-dependent methyltransferase [Thaumarchaeota archaeon]|nr:class I SAM-dependent methyltransferase [Nitrososphaerota archaeon]
MNQTLQQITSKNSYKSEFWEENSNDPKAWENTLIVKKSCAEYFKRFFPGFKCFDLGFGRGASIFVLTKMGFKVDGIEPDSKNFETVSKKLPAGKYYEGYFGETEINDKYDVIWISHVLEHVERPDILLEKCKKLTKDLAVMCIMVPDCDNPEMLQNSMSNKHHIWHFTKKSLVLLAQKCGFSVIECKSFAVMKKNRRRFHKLLRICKLESLSKIIDQCYPFVTTSNSDGYEIRMVLSNKKG